MTSDRFSARAWKFGDNIDTELMLPGPYLWHSPEERARVVFQANRPGWVDQVRDGDAIVAGTNFGIGSSRPAALSLKLCGIRFVLADSINGLFLRTAVNFGLLAFECTGASSLVSRDCEEVILDISTWTACNPATGAQVPVRPLSPLPMSIMRAGGVIRVLEGQGLIATAAESASSSDAKAPAGKGDA
jgi:3-isopropylmalate/(R)-2-methylmalate dehydratase small subunit